MISGDHADPALLREYDQLRKQLGPDAKDDSTGERRAVIMLECAGAGDARAHLDADAVVEAALTQAAMWDEMKDSLDKPGGSLSGGQQQRLCIARALAVEPEVLLMDEPASALDPIATAKIEDLIHELKDRYTIAIVTHNMQQAARVSDQTAFFYMGELVEAGPTEQIFTNPRESRTEDYVTGKFG